jgi:tetratricopeptide (TPR) repeat protein
MENPNEPRRSIAQTLRQLTSLLPRREDTAAESQLYYRRACLAAAEERYDVALIFCGKSLELDSRNLPTRLLAAQIRHFGLNQPDAAIAGYQKVITLAGYDGENPYCSAARAGLDELVQARVAPPAAAPRENVPA